MPCLPAHLAGMGGPVEFDEPDNPVCVRTVGAKGVVMMPQHVANLINQPPGLRAVLLAHFDASAIRLSRCYWLQSQSNISTMQKFININAVNIQSNSSTY